MESTKANGHLSSRNAKPVMETRGKDHISPDDLRLNMGKQIKQGPSELERADFPKHFVFGTASSAYQYEGAAKECGRGPSIWDTFTEEFPGKIADGSNGDVAVDFYHQFKDDVYTIKKLGFDAFRFSISWSRVLPSGKLSAGVNKEGIKFYSKLIDEVLANGLTPFVTLFHWDLPQALEYEYGGFLSSRIVDDFCDYAELCFWEFGDRVKHWITLNEPWSYCHGGYVLGTQAPGRGGSLQKTKGSQELLNRGCANVQQPLNNGNPGTEPYLVGHNQLLAHAAAVKLYREKYQKCQKGKIGITLISHWMVPYSNSNSDHDAAQRALDFMFGWFMEPLTTGDYPHSMQKLVKKRLPEFSYIESAMVKGSFDFLGLNYYTGKYVYDAPNSDNEQLSYDTDQEAKWSNERNGIPIGPQVGSDWLYIYPKGFYDLLIYTKEKYNNPLIYITENGVSEVNDIKLTLKEAREDNIRKKYYVSHLRCLLDAIHDGVNVKGYFQWSLLDNFEWSDGYKQRFGIIYVDYKDEYLTRHPKESAIWFMNFLKNDIHSVPNCWSFLQFWNARKHKSFSKSQRKNILTFQN